VPGRTYSAKAVLAGASAAQTAVSLISYGLPAIGPDLRRHFGLSLTELGAVLTANLLGSGLALIVAGIAVDRYGSRAATLVGTAVSTGGLIGAALASSKAVLFAGLLVSGIGSAVVPIAGAGALFRVFPPARRAFALGIRQMAVPLAGTISAGAMPGLVALGGIRLALLFGAAALATTGIALAVVVEHEPLPAPARRQGVRTILRAPGMLRLLVVAAFYIVVLQAMLVYTVPAARAFGLSAFAAGATYFVITATAMAARLVWGRVADRNEGARRSRTLFEVGVVAAVGGVLFTFALHAGAAALIPAAIVFAFGAFGWNALVYVSAGERSGPELAGRSVAVAATLVFVLSAVTTPPLGSLADHVGWDAFWGATAGLAAIGAGVAATLSR
jgi:MFS family permease